MRKLSFDPSAVCMAIILGCLAYSIFHKSGLLILKDLMIAAVSGYFGYLKGGENEEP
jgi:hypothetical protein